MFSDFNHLKLVLGHLCSWDFVKIFTCSLVFAFNHSLTTCSVLVLSSHTESIPEVVRLRKDFLSKHKISLCGEKIWRGRGCGWSGLFEDKTGPELKERIKNLGMPQKY